MPDDRRVSDPPAPPAPAALEVAALVSRPPPRRAARLPWLVAVLCVAMLGVWGVHRAARPLTALHASTISSQFSQPWAFPHGISVGARSLVTRATLPLLTPVNRVSFHSSTTVATRRKPTTTTHFATPEESSNALESIAGAVPKPPKRTLWKRIKQFFRRGPELPVRLPLTVMTLPRQRYVGAGYYLLPFTLARLFWTSRPMYFMVDSGLTGTLLTPEAKEYLYAIPTDTSVEGLAGVGNIQAPLVFVDRMKVGGAVPCRSTVAAVVDFFQAQAGAEMGLDIAGMVGMEFLEQYDVELDPFAEEATLYDPEEPPAPQPGAVVVKGCQLPGNLIGAILQGYRWPTATEEASGIRPTELGPPILGIVDTGATYSIINWKAAKALGISPDDPRVKAAGTVSMMGVEGKRQRMPLLRMRMEVCGFAKAPEPTITFVDETNANNSKWMMDEMQRDPEGRVSFDKPASVGIGDINFHNLLRMKGKGVYDGPAAIIGQDLWVQRRMLISGSRRTLTVYPPDWQTAASAGG
eukprot:EG_transcript_7502